MGELLPNQPVPLLKRRLELSREQALTAQLGLDPGDEFEIKLGRKQVELIPSAPVSPQWQRGRPIRSWDGCMGRPKGKEPQSCCIPFRCWPPPV